MLSGIHYGIRNILKKKPIERQETLQPEVDFWHTLTNESSSESTVMRAVLCCTCFSKTAMQEAHSLFMISCCTADDKDKTKTTEQVVPVSSSS